MIHFTYKVIRLKPPVQPFYLACLLAFVACIHPLKAQPTADTVLPVDGFESPTTVSLVYKPTSTVWTFFGRAGFSNNNSHLTKNRLQAPEGNQVMFLQSVGRAHRSYKVAEAGYYRVWVKAALRAKVLNIQRPNVGIRIDGIDLGNIQVPSNAYTDLHSLAIYLTAGNHTIELRRINSKIGDQTAFVDDLRLEKLHDWQKTATWRDTQPNSSQMVTIPAGTTVVMNGKIKAKRIMVHGHLVAAQNRDLDITTHNIMVMGADALFELGQALVPYPKKATITLNAPGDGTDTSHPTMGDNYLGAMGDARLEMHGLAKTSWTKLQSGGAVGSNQVVLAEATTHWKSGDEIIITSNRLTKENNVWADRSEKRTIVSVAGTQITLDKALTYAHDGGVKTYTNNDDSKTWTADLRAEVGMLTHNIKIQGAPTNTGYGGHIMMMGKGKAYVSGVELYNMGQKQKMGRYPFHWHMLGKAGKGQYFKNSSVHKSYNRAITIHGTDSTLVENNFCYDHIGHGVFLEDGSERFNTIRKNVVLLTKRPKKGEELIASDNELDKMQDRTPASFWITNPQNTFEDNIAAGTHGTGYWFAFPTKPTGASAKDPRFKSMEPHKSPLISFKGNVAHSCMTGFDIFDQIGPDHKILVSRGWDNKEEHLMENCLWFANDVALYAGFGWLLPNPQGPFVLGPTDNLIFRNNILVENKAGTMFASNCIIDNSVFVAHSGYNFIPANMQRQAYLVYDGPGQIHHSHFIGWDHKKANLLGNIGSAIKHVNHIFRGNTTDQVVRCKLDNFNIQPTNDQPLFRLRPRLWSVVVKDETGTFTGEPNTALVSNHPFILVGDEENPHPDKWANVYRSHHRFALATLNYPGTHKDQFPNIVVTRQKQGAESQQVLYRPDDNQVDHYQSLPVIVNEGFEYVYEFDSLPSTKQIQMRMDDATAGDEFTTIFKDFGKLVGLEVAAINCPSCPDKTALSMSPYTSLDDLRSAPGSGYYIEPAGDLYVKVKAIGNRQYYKLTWNTNFVVPIMDTDGDGMSNVDEYLKSRSMFDAKDLETGFDKTDNADKFEGWTKLYHVVNVQVKDGALRGTSNNSGIRAAIINDQFNFRADRVQTIQVRMKASHNVPVLLFFYINDESYFPAKNKPLIAHYTGNGDWQTLTFNVSNQPDWKGTITALRLDPVNVPNTSFEIDWVKSSYIDTDGDGMSDVEENRKNRDQLNAKDLETGFDKTDNADKFEGWTKLYHVVNVQVKDGTLRGTSNEDSGDAIITNHQFNFQANQVQTIQVRMKSSEDVVPQILFATNTNPHFSGSRVISVRYSGNNEWKILTFNVGNHPDWKGTITALRLDPVNVPNTSFEIDWVKSCTDCVAAGASSARTTTQGFVQPQSESKVNLYPNPLGEQLFIKGIGEGTIVRIFDMQSKLRKKLAYKGSINVTDLEAGIYLVEVNGTFYKVLKEE
ncbi:G8 domain-containing protein [uncultured Microscilla sp.]|uniref:G8 domain-containing protein n=1 Tax=uncultured Microscilla sp. TaxID=432653 RepID=UPI00261E229A|nr:G8 domain-containing protein [uncultured Microscilla sp.]